MNKRKLLLLAVALCMAAILVTGGTLAFLTDTDAQKNTFTAGKVGLTLHEAVVTTENDDPNGKYTGVTSERTEDDQTYKVFPGDVITKDPTITVDDDSEDAYVAAIITIKGELGDLIPMTGTDSIDITKLASGGLLTGLADVTPAAWKDVSELPFFATGKCHVTYDATKASENTWVMFIFIDAVQTAGTDIPLFDTITIPAAWDNDEMLAFHNTTIDINAYAVQADGFENCFAAMTTAHKDDFAILTAEPAAPII